MRVSIVHDFACPMCWIGLLQYQRLLDEFQVEVDWIGAELWPRELVRANPNARRAESEHSDSKSKLAALEAADGVTVPLMPRPAEIDTRFAHLAVERAKRLGTATRLVESLYRAYWEAGLDLSAREITERLALPHCGPIEALRSDLDAYRGLEQIVQFDDAARSAGISAVPTWIIAGMRYAEQPIFVLRNALQQAREAVA